jgi:hypothetical protein
MKSPLGPLTLIGDPSALRALYFPGRSDPLDKAIATTKSLLNDLPEAEVCAGVEPALPTDAVAQSLGPPAGAPTRPDTGPSDGHGRRLRRSTAARKPRPGRGPPGAIGSAG